MKVQLRFRIVYALLRPILRLYFTLRYNVHITPYRPKSESNGPYLIISNHNSNLDMFFVAFCLDFPIFFVASDHLFRKGLISKAINYLVSPIPKLKASSDIQTIRSMMAYLKEGKSVCVFPEGNRSWGGETEEITPAIGKLVYRLGVSLLTCRIDGAYLAAPRWADKMRRGRIECRVTREMSPEEIKTHTPQELTEMIRNDLYVDAMEVQKRWQVPYTCKNLAQSIETVLFTCPACGCFATIRSKGDTARCSCGLKFRYDKLGYLHGAPFQTVLEWVRWQKRNLNDTLPKLRQRKAGDPFFSDVGQRLLSVQRASQSQLVETGDLSMYRDRLVFRGREKTLQFPFDKITHITVWGRMSLQFSLSDGHYYEVLSTHPRSAYKYQELFQALNGPVGEKALG